MNVPVQPTAAQPDLPREVGTLVAVASIIVSTYLTAVGNGLMFAYIPLSLDKAGYAPSWAGLILTALSAGGLVACLMTGALARRVGHARAFMIFSALIILSNAALGAGVHPVPWLGARALYGFAISGMFIVAQSWLNDAVTNAIRGRVMAVFYVAYVAGLGTGSFLMGQVDLSGSTAPMAGIAFAALAILPVGMTRLPLPPPPESASVAFRRAWSVSPVGLAGMLAVGGLSMMVAGFTPIHVAASGYSQLEVALLMSAMPLGSVLFQIPLGWLSDRMDRRIVMVGAAIVVAGAGIAAGIFDGRALAVMVPIYLVWAGTTESIYSLSNAHANDRASKDEMVALSSTMLFAWSFSGVLVPAIATGLTAVYGTVAFIYVAVSIATVFAVFVLWRIGQRQQVPSEETGSFAPLAAQTPLPVDLATPDMEPELAEIVSAGPRDPAR
ncbi:MAG: MFS transporter [Rhizobiaceae bacterium]|nr:MFS transporter [Rhizobiaceae bacterium]